MQWLEFVSRWKTRLIRFTGLHGEVLATDLVFRQQEETESFIGPGQASGEVRSLFHLPPRPDEQDLLRQLYDSWLTLWWLDMQAGHAPPSFLGPGLARHLEGKNRLADFDCVDRRWRNAGLPGIAGLLEQALADPLADPALASQLTLFLLHGESRGSRLRRMAEADYAAETASPEWFAHLVLGSPEVAALDEMWDSWLLRRASSVVKPGQWSPGVVGRFRSQLLVFPGAHDLPLARPLVPGIGFRRLLDFRRESWMAAVVEAKTRDIMRYSAGRGDGMMEVAEAYIGFLEGLTGREKTGSLRQRLLEAETMLLRLEREN